MRTDDKRVTRLTLDVKGKDTIIHDKNDSDADFKKKKSGDDGWYYLGMFSQIGFSIAIPIAGCAILGKMADSYWMSSPRFTLVGLGIGITVSIVTFIRSIQIVIRDTSK